MIYATGVQYRVIKTALEKLDSVATQVMIEASIVEVQLTDELKYGLEWTFKGGLGSDSALAQAPVAKASSTKAMTEIPDDWTPWKDPNNPNVASGR